MIVTWGLWCWRSSSSCSDDIDFDPIIAFDWLEDTMSKERQVSEDLQNREKVRTRLANASLRPDFPKVCIWVALGIACTLTPTPGQGLTGKAFSGVHTLSCHRPHLSQQLALKSDDWQRDLRRWPGRDCADGLTQLWHGGFLPAESRALKNAWHSDYIAIFRAVVEDRRALVLGRT